MTTTNLSHHHLSKNHQEASEILRKFIMAYSRGEWPLISALWKPILIKLQNVAGPLTVLTMKHEEKIVLRVAGLLAHRLDGWLGHPVGPSPPQHQCILVALTSNR